MTPEKFMLRAAALAARGQGRTRPNPCVGAVVVRDGAIVGEGWHERAGGDHAEVVALKAAGDAARGATVYVTLEPCSRAGRVGACTDALAAAGVSRVVYGASDPNPVNAGKAQAALARSGIVCERFAGSAAVSRRCEELIAPFKKHIFTGLPFVTVKLAMSLDGRTCDSRGCAAWISSAASRRRTNALRSRVDAIMVGAETVRRDNPSLTSRVRPNPGLLRVVVSRSGNLPRDARIFTDGENETLVFRDGAQALEELGRMGVLHVLCEGGLALAVSLAKAGLVDEWLTVLSPVVIGGDPVADAFRAPARDIFARFPLRGVK